jgi:hypothetical protein
MAKRKNPIRHKWTGPLAKPIKWRGPLTRVTPPILGGEPSAEFQAKYAARYDTAAARAFIESALKLNLLKQHFEVPDGEGSGPWICLALALARYADIPGFRVEQPWEGRGRKRDIWMDSRYVGLVLDVERVKAEHKIKRDLAALRHLAENPSRYNSNKPSQNWETQKKLAATLNSRLTEARRLVREKKLEGYIDPSNQACIAIFGPDFPEGFDFSD